MKKEIVLPHNFRYRFYQKNLAECLDKYKRGFFVWHRRGGKDLCCWNIVIEQAIQKKGVYWYILPTYEQARKTVWNSITNEGETFFDFIPPEIEANRNNQKMKIELINGSIIQVIGSDRYDGLRGANPVGVVFSEFAFQHPIVWEKVVKPILKVNKGWALFNTTPNGENHAYELFEMAKDNPEWYTEILTIEDTGVLTAEDMDKEREEGVDESTIQQEYYCSFSAVSQGSIYKLQMEDAEKRVTHLPIERGEEVHIWMDIGKSDTTAILFVQLIGKEIRIIDAYEDFGKEVDDYCDILEGKGYKFGFMHLPHDAYHEKLGMKYTVAAQFEKRGFKVKKVPHLQKADTGIQLARKYFPRVWFDKEKTFDLRRALKNYHYKYDPVKKVYSKYPEHDWSSHYADAFRYLAVSYNQEPLEDYRVARDAYVSSTVTPKYGRLEQQLTAKRSRDRYVNSSTGY